MPGPTIIAIDFETANQAQNSACQLGLVRVENWQVVAAKAWLIRPPSDEFMFTDIHGLTWDHVRDSPDFGALWPEVTPLIEGANFMAAHNAPFDRGVLRAICHDHAIAPPTEPFLDTVIIARQVWNIFPTKLNLVCKHLGIPLQHHEALSDANACAQILIRANATGWAPKAPKAPKPSDQA